MTSDQKIKVLSDALDRAYQAVESSSAEDMREHWFAQLMNNLGQLEEMGLRIHFTRDKELGLPNSGTGESDVQETERVSIVSGATGDDGTPKESLEVPSETPATEPEEAENPAPTYTREEVKRALARARVKRVNVVAVLRQVGTDSFLTLTENKFAEVMQIIEQEVQK